MTAYRVGAILESIFWLSILLGLILIDFALVLLIIYLWPK